MKTPALLTVPKDSPTLKERIEAFKVKHGIETQISSWAAVEDKWLALHRIGTAKALRGYGYSCRASLPELYARFGRLIDESGNDAYGATEREAIQNLCANKQIVCDL